MRIEKDRNEAAGPGPVDRMHLLVALVGLVAALAAAFAVPGVQAGAADYPKGAVKLSKDQIKKVGKVTCGNIKKNIWVPGTKLSKKWFISHKDYAKYYAKLAKKAEGAKAKKFRRKAKKLRKRAGKEWKVCNGGAPVRFDISGALGLALAKPGTTGASETGRERLEEGSSNLDAIGPGGQVTDAVVSGSASFRSFEIAENGKVYAVFDGSHTLEDGTRCVLAEIDPATDVPTCIESELVMGGYVQYDNFVPNVQIDSAGAIYYYGAQQGQLVLRRYLDGVKKDLIADSVQINNFLVLPDRSVLLSGQTDATGAVWTRRVLPTGGLQTVRNSPSLFFGLFPDGNVYLAFYDPGNFGIRRYLIPSHQVEERFWIGDDPGSYFPVQDYCAPEHESTRYGFCHSAGGVGARNLFETPDGRVYVIAGGSSFVNEGTLVQYFPTVAFPTTIVRVVTAADDVGGKIAIAGLNATGQNVMQLYDPATDTETELLRPADEIEVYHLSYVASQNKLIFDGLRFVDNSYVVGEIDMATKQITFSPTGTKWEDLQTFG